MVARYAERVIVMYAGRIIESGSATDVYHHPKHPYTLGLLKSVPRLDEDRPEKLEAIEGLPPLVIDLPDACAFAPRCPYVIDKCSEAMPELKEISRTTGRAATGRKSLTRSPRPRPRVHSEVKPQSGLR